MFFTSQQLQEHTGGQWLRHALAEGPLRGIGIDSRDELSGKAFIAIRGPNHDGHSFAAQAAIAGAALLVVDQAVDLNSIPKAASVLRVPDTRTALLQVAAAWRDRLDNTKVIAVTGSSGKTTTRRLIHAVLSPSLGVSLRGSQSPKSFNNEIGVPMTLLAALPQDDFLVVEIGTNAPGEIEKLSAVVRPDIAVITSIGRAHLQRLGGLEGVAREKASILRHVRVDGLAIVNADSPELQSEIGNGQSSMGIGKGLSSRSISSLPIAHRPSPISHGVLSFGTSRNAAMRLTARGPAGAPGRWWFEINSHRRFEIALPGEHNAMNAIAAVAVADRFHLTDQQIQVGLDSVQSADMRFSIQSIGPIRICNDAYNANPESMNAALETFAELSADAARRVVVIGDMLELGDCGPELHSELGSIIRRLNERCPIGMLALIGPLAAHVAEGFAGPKATGNRQQGAPGLPKGDRIAYGIPDQSQFNRDWRPQAMGPLPIAHSPLPMAHGPLPEVLHVPALNDAAASRIASMLHDGDWVLLKASRGMAVERVLPAIHERFAGVGVGVPNRD